MDRVGRKSRGLEAEPGPKRRSPPTRQRQETLRPRHAYEKKTIALVYDFDGTLCPKPMQEYAFLPKIGVDASAFWTESNALALKEGADPLITYMHLLYKKAKAAGVRIDRDDLVAQGRQVELYPGVETWFDEIDGYVAASDHGEHVQVRHYLISSGLQEIIEGTPIFKRFHNVFASEYWFEAYDLPYPKRVITDTGKTQYLFRINKGVENLGESINQHMPENDRPVPFSHMIYFGDGDTDVPSMAVMKKSGGHAIAVHAPGKSKIKGMELFKAKRCDFFAAADYRRDGELWNRTCLLVDRILADIRVEQEMWRLTRETDRKG